MAKRAGPALDALAAPPKKQSRTDTSIEDLEELGGKSDAILLAGDEFRNAADRSDPNDDDASSRASCGKLSFVSTCC
jgi:hypothetical protein